MHICGMIVMYFYHTAKGWAAMFEREKLTTSQLVAEYKDTVMVLAGYLPYFEKKSGESVMSSYVPEHAIETTMRIPTYDSTLLSFVKEAEKTCFINRNYDYVYRKYAMRTPKDELRMIERATIHDMDVFGAILSKYIIRGRTRGTVWNEGVKNGVYYHLLSRMKEVIEFWDMPYHNLEEQ